MAAAGSNQWNASPTKTASRLPSSSGIASARPVESPAVHRPHPRVRLDGDDLAEAVRELPCQPAGAGSEIEDAGARIELQGLLRPVEQQLRVRRPDPVVGLRDVAEAQPELGHRDQLLVAHSKFVRMRKT